MTDSSSRLTEEVNKAFEVADRVAERFEGGMPVDEVGSIRSIESAIAHIDGLPRVQSEELLRFPGELYGMAFNLDPGAVGAILLDKSDALEAGMSVQRTGRVLSVPVGEGVLGRVVDPLVRPLDGLGKIPAAEHLPVEQNAPGITSRAAVQEPLQTGIKVIDALIPIGKGQRELILGDRQTGKTAVALDSIINQRDKNVVCIYCAIGERSASVAKVVAELKRQDSLGHTIVVVSTGEDAPGLQYIAPYTATTLGEYFLRKGRDVLVVYDDLTRHARAYRELSLLLRRPPGREAFPGDIFYLHSRLLERATRLHEKAGGGSLTALPIVETEAQDISGYIPTNVISITDGQIYLSPTLFRKGILPAIDVGKSVSRVGGKAQLRAYRAVTGSLRLAYAQFEELEAFARFGTRLEEQTRRQLERGYRIREVLKQGRAAPLSATEQIALFFAVNEGVFDELDVSQLVQAEAELLKVLRERGAELEAQVARGVNLTERDSELLAEIARKAVSLVRGERGDPGTT